MNLFFGGSLGSLMKPHFYKKFGVRTLLRNQLKQNILCKWCLQIELKRDKIVAKEKYSVFKATTECCNVFLF